MKTSDLQQRRRELAHVRLIHDVAHAYNCACYGLNGHDIDADPGLVSTRQWQATLRMAETFVRSGGTLSPAQVRNQWAMEMSAQDALTFLNHDLLKPLEDLPEHKQLEEIFATAAMRDVMRKAVPVIIENHHAMDEGQLQWAAHGNRPSVANVVSARGGFVGRVSASVGLVSVPVYDYFSTVAG